MLSYPVSPWESDEGCQGWCMYFPIPNEELKSRTPNILKNHLVKGFFSGEWKPNRPRQHPCATTPASFSGHPLGQSHALCFLLAGYFRIGALGVNEKHVQTMVSVCSLDVCHSQCKKRHECFKGKYTYVIIFGSLNSVSRIRWLFLCGVFAQIAGYTTPCLGCNLICWIVIWGVPNTRNVDQPRGWRLKPLQLVNDYSPRNLTWNLKTMVSKRNILFRGLLFRFHVKFQGCKWCAKKKPCKKTHGFRWPCECRKTIDPHTFGTSVANQKPKVVWVVIMDDNLWRNIVAPSFHLHIIDDCQIRL